MSFWASHGLTRIDGRPLGDGDAGLLVPAGRQGPAFLVTRNFDVVFSYNAAESYTLAACVLSDRLGGGRGIVTPWPTDDLLLSRDGRKELQALLQRRGYDVGDARTATSAPRARPRSPISSSELASRSTAAPRSRCWKR